MMEQFIDDVYEVVKKHQLMSGMSYAEAIGMMQLISDDLSERCRKDLQHPTGDSFP